MEILGLININDIEVLQIDSDPTALTGLAAPLGSLASVTLATTAELYYKFGTADTSWKKVDLSDNDWGLNGNSLVAGQFLGSTNDENVNFQRNNQQIMSILSSGLLIGLNSSLGGKLQVGAEIGDIVSNFTSIDGANKVIRIARQFRVLTTDATLTELAAIALDSNQRIQAEMVIMGNQTGGSIGSIGDGADYKFIASAKNIGGSAILNRKANIFTSEDDRDFKAKVEVNSSNVILSVKGEVNRNMTWNAHIEYSLLIE